MKHYLFEGFLSEKLIYEICRQYWKVKFNDWFTRNKITTAEPYLTTKFGDGTDYFNGNPMVNYNIIDIGRSIRIIQHEPNPKDFEIDAWLDKFETDEFKTKELVISIQLSPHTERIAFELIKKWIIDQLPEKKMDKFIDLKMELEQLELTEQKKEMIA